MEYTSAARLETRASHISSVLFRIRWFQKAAEREAHKIASSKMLSLSIISELNKLREAFIAEQLHD